MRVGHAGTLDPFATGLLIVLLGAGTRLQRYVLGLPKSYLATARLGWRSSTGDRDGELTETGAIPERLQLPTGLMDQRVPMTSAVRVDGERLYHKARRGEEVERPVRSIEVTRAELVETGEGTATFAIDCSSGTYVRTLIEVLDDAYCESLRRTSIGQMRIEDAGERVHPVEDLLGFLPEVPLDEAEAKLVRNGIKIDAPPGTSSGPIRLTNESSLIAVARVTDGRLKTEMVLPFD